MLDGLRIGQITDTHLGFRYAGANLAWAVEQMRRAAPDLLAITGDLVHFSRQIPQLPVLLRGLNAPLGCYAVPGNHDYWEGVNDIRDAIGILGIPMLLNEHRRLHWNGAELWLAGIDDYWDGAADIDKALQGVPTGAFTIMLAHEPDTADEVARRGVALQLSGHTHGGHLRLPWLGPFTRPRYGVRYVMGEYQIGAMKLYVSRGLGGAPLRLLCRPEATIFTLRRG
jgi:predicted MPP superfamily phosphohydrolase